MRATDVLNPEGLRIDGRRANELRRISCQVGIDSQADGSSMIEIGQTKVIALVFGPHEAKGKGNHDSVIVNATFKISPYASSDRKYRAKSDKRLLEMSIFLKQTFEQVIVTSLYPRSQIDICLQVLQTDGDLTEGTLHACLNAASLALVDAGIPMNDYICACSAGFVGDSAILDLSQYEESASYDIPKFTIAVTPNNGKVILLSLESRMPLDKFELVRNLAVEGAKQIRMVLDAAVRQGAKDHLLSRIHLIDNN